jgi:hypothetical protein
MNGNGHPPGFVVRAVAVEPGQARAYDDAEWRDAIVAVALGDLELECLSGSAYRFRQGSVLWLADLPLRALHNRGSEPVVLVAVARG